MNGDDERMRWMDTMIGSRRGGRRMDYEKKKR